VSEHLTIRPFRVLAWGPFACSWTGPTRRIVVVGPQPNGIIIPAGAVIHDVPDGEDAHAMAERIGGTVATVFR
jgi:hypothetical protein